MNWSVVWTRPALHDLRRLDRQAAERSRAAVRRYAETEHGDIKRLQGIDPPSWRLRVGDHRVLIELDYAARTLRVLRVLPRGSAYRNP